MQLDIIFSQIKGKSQDSLKYVDLYSNSFSGTRNSNQIQLFQNCCFRIADVHISKICDSSTIYHDALEHLWICSVIRCARTWCIGRRLVVQTALRINFEKKGFTVPTWLSDMPSFQYSVSQLAPIALREHSPLSYMYISDYSDYYAMQRNQYDSNIVLFSPCNEFSLS